MLERYGRNGVLLIESGVAYHKTEETDLCWSATIEMGVMFIGRGVAYRKTGTTGYCSSPPSTSSSLHWLPPTSSSLHRALLHRPLFNHPFIVYCSSIPPHHGVLFNHPPSQRSLFIQSIGFS